MEGLTLKVMEPIAALHTAARRYCISLVPLLDPRAGEAEYNDPDLMEDDSEPYVESSRDEYWRTQFLPVVLREIERKTPEDFRSLDELRAFLISVGHDVPFVPWQYGTARYASEPLSSAPPPDKEDIGRITDERLRFSAYVAQLSDDDLRDVAHLPFRRTLSDDEANAIWEALHVRWPSYYLWFLDSKELRGYEHRHMEGVLRFWWFLFAEHVQLDILRTTLREAGVQRVWQVGDDDKEPFEIGIDAFVPKGVEAHFTPSGFGWVVYCDHEEQISLAGNILVDMIRDVWADWERYLDEDYIEDEADTGSDQL